MGDASRHIRSGKAGSRFIFPALAVTLVIGVVFLLRVPKAEAVPAFTRQTGLACTTCHSTFPELTPFGRAFKLNGYTLSNSNIEEKGGGKQSPLAILDKIPLTIDLRGSLTETDKEQPGTHNGNVEVPQQVNLFFAGRLAGHAGGYVQMTYNVEANHFGFDNSDVRYANNTKPAGKDFVYGVDFNNNPTFEDLWHSTPAYGFPWASPDAVPTPAVRTIIDTTLGGDVVGLGAYGMWNDHLYGDVTLYRTQHIGVPQPATGTGFAFNTDKVAPYWRFAYQMSEGKNYLEFGTYGIHMASFPGAISGLTDDYTDTAIDAQYERTIGKDLLSVYSTFIYEGQYLNAIFTAGSAAQARHHLETFRVNGTYHFGSRYAATLGTFVTDGTHDALLLAPAAITGSANGSPRTSGYITNFGYWPVQNVEIGAQYNGYVKFNGGGRNYDGFGRNASDNNYAYLFFWIAF